MGNAGSERLSDVLSEPGERGAVQFKHLDADAKIQPHKVVSVLFAILSFTLLCLNVALITQNRRLKAIAEAPSPAFAPSIGMKISKLDGAALDGSRLTLPFNGDGRKTLLLVFSTNCRVCDLNWPAWQSLAPSIAGRPYRLVYGNIRSFLTRSYVASHDMSGATVIAEIDPGTSAKLHLQVTPLSVLLASDGTVEEVWPGLLEGDDLAELR